MSERIKAAPSASLHGTDRLVVDLPAAGITVGIFRVDGKLYAYENTCPHQGGPVCQGLRIDAVRELLNDSSAPAGFAFDAGDPRIVCPWHGFEFSVKTGCHPGNPAIRLNAIPVEEEGGILYVRI